MSAPELNAYIFDYHYWGYSCVVIAESEKDARTLAMLVGRKVGEPGVTVEVKPLERGLLVDAGEWPAGW